MVRDFENNNFNYHLKHDDFVRLSQFISNNYGIKLPDKKRIMVQSRLQKRLRKLNLPSFKEYCDLVLNEKSPYSEINLMIDAVSTNKTDFFREPTHFSFIENVLFENAGADQFAGKKVKIWSAGCSSGEEVYTLAMVFNELSNANKLSGFSVFGTDISEEMLRKAILGIYPYDKFRDIPEDFRKMHLLKSKGNIDQKIRISLQLRTKVSFAKMNLMDEHYAVNGLFDIIFCRNTLIYFDRNTQNEVLLKLIKKLNKGGYLFIGHSESLINTELPIEQVQPTIYKKVDD